MQSKPSAKRQLCAWEAGRAFFRPNVDCKTVGEDFGISGRRGLILRTSICLVVIASALAAGTSTNHTTHVVTSESYNVQYALSKFSAPAYLAPPIDSLYSSLMDHFLSKLPEKGSSTEEVETPQDEEMAVDEDAPVVNVPFVGRTV